MSTTTLQKTPAVIVSTKDSGPFGWKVVIFNCYCHIFDEVVNQIMRATQFTREKSTDIASVAENTGSATVCEGSQEHCEKVARILGGVGLNVTVIQ